MVLSLTIPCLHTSSVINATQEASAVWQAYTDVVGRSYYYNKRTKQSSWEKPLELMTPLERADASTVWEEFTTAEGTNYYYNKDTKQSTWTMPEALKLAREQVDSQSNLAAAMAKLTAAISQLVPAATPPYHNPTMTTKLVAPITNTAQLETISTQTHDSCEIANFNSPYPFTKTDTKVANRMPPSTVHQIPDSPKLQQENLIIQPSILPPTYDHVKAAVKTLAVAKVQVYSSNQPVAMPLQRLSTTTIHAKCSHEVYLWCPKNFSPHRQCHPPKFVFLQFERKPPWDCPDPRYHHLSLEDKARFKAGGIDTIRATTSGQAPAAQHVTAQQAHRPTRVSRSQQVIGMNSSTAVAQLLLQFP